MFSGLWINLPVKDLEQSKAFFTEIGFSVQAIGEGVRVVIGDKESTVMLFEETKFQSFTHHEVMDAEKATEVLFSIGAKSKEDVDSLINKVKQAGGKIYGEPAESEGWLYGAGFVDLDGHRWNILYMDMERMPQ